MAALLPGILRPLEDTREGYAQFVGLWLNRRSVIAQWEHIGYVGSSYAQGNGDLPAEFFLAVCDDEASAFEAMVKANNARSMARARAMPRNTAREGIF